MFDRKFIQYFDWGLLGLVLSLSCLGFITLYSVATAGEATLDKMFYIKQLVWLCAGLILMVFSFLFNYKLLNRWAYTIYAVCILLLIAVLFLGKYVVPQQQTRYRNCHKLRCILYTYTVMYIVNPRRLHFL